MSLYFFSDPLPNELMYSAIARTMYFTDSSTQKMQKTIFDNKKNVPKPLITNCLNHIGQSINDVYSPAYILENHTVFNYYSSFINKERKEIVTEILRSSEDGDLVRKYLGINESSVIVRNNIRYCPECAKNDAIDYGVPYFHREHNLDKIFCCPNCGSDLKRYPIDKLSKNQYIFFDAKMIENNTHKISLKNDQYNSLSKYSRDILCKYYKFFNKEDNTNRLKVLLNEKGFLYSNGRLKRKEFSNAIASFYGDEFLSDVGCEINKNDSNNWIYRIGLSSSGNFITPIQTLLLINYFCTSIEEFINIRTQEQTFTKRIKGYSEETLNKYKEDLVTIIEREPDNKRHDIRIKLPNQYVYVFNNDRDWFEEKMPKPTFEYKPKKKEYSEKLDKKYVELLKKQYGLILGLPDTVRITPYTLSKGIIEPNLFNKERFPLAKDFATSVTESYDDARIRKCKKAIDQFFDAGITPTHYQIRTNSKISDMSRYNNIKNDVEEYLKHKLESVISCFNNPHLN